MTLLGKFGWRRPTPWAGAGNGVAGQLAAVRRLTGKAYSRRRRAATCAAAAMAIAVGYHVVFGQNGLTAYRQKRQDTHALEEQIRKLGEENEALSGHVDRLASDPGSIEHQAREELHYTRPGEVIVTLPADTPATPEAKR